MNNKLFHAMNFTKTFIDVESGSFISLPKDGTDKPPVNADINNNIDTFHSTGGEGMSDTPIPIVNISEWNKTVCGRNLFNPSVNFTNSSKSGEVYTLKIKSPATDFFVYRNQLLSNVKLKPLTSYMFTFVCTRNTADINLVMANLASAVFANTTTTLFTAGQTGTKTIAVSTRDFTSTTYTYGFYLQGYGSQDAGEWDIQIQLEEGSTATPYQSYNGQTYPYCLEDVNEVLHEAGDLPDGTADSVNWETGILYKNISEKKILNNTMGWSLTTPPTAPDLLRFSSNFFNSVVARPGNGGLLWYKSSIPYDTYNKLDPSTNLLEGLYFEPWTGHIRLRLFKTTLAPYGLVADDTATYLTAFYTYLAAKSVEVIFKLATPITYQIKQYGETYGGAVWEYNEKPKSIQYHTNIFTDKNITMQCEVRKLGNRKMILANLKTSSGKVLMTESGKIIQVKI